MLCPYSYAAKLTGGTCMEQQLKVIIIDDHGMVREGLKQLIELENDIKVIAQAGDGIEGIEKILEYKPDIILLDINMPRMNGIQVVEKLKELSINCKIIILTIHNDIEYLFKAVEIGVQGYVLKDSDADTLINAIRTVDRGESYIQPNLTTQLVKRMNRNYQPQKKVTNDLTKRELEVLQLITEGLLNKEIATHLCISEKTVKNHVSNIFKKIQVNDRTQAAVYAIKNNLVKLF